MRAVADEPRIRAFMAALGRAGREEGTCYLVGGATAVLIGWRETTIDVDLKLVPEADELLRAIQRLKHELSINVELASPEDFIPLPAGWEERSPFEAREGLVTFRHFDPYSQALAKLERGHPQDVVDVEAMVNRGLVDRTLALRFFDEIEPQLYRFPAIDPKSFRARVQIALRR